MSAVQANIRHGLVARISTGSAGKDMFAVMIPRGLDVAGEDSSILTAAASACRPHAYVPEFDLAFVHHAICIFCPNPLETLL